MESHVYEFNGIDLLKRFGPALGVVALLAIALRVGPRAISAPRPALDVDRTILVHQADASRHSQDAALILVGDSSCMMDVDTVRLTGLLHVPSLNLGTLSYLDFKAHGQLIANYAAANPGKLKTVVLLLNPEALRRSGADEAYQQWLDDYLAGHDSGPPADWNGRLQRTLGLNVFQGRILTKLLPNPLGEPFGAAYGFTWDLERYLTQHRGSALDPSRKRATGTPEYSLHRNALTASRHVREKLPAGARLLAGITPLPEEFTYPDYAARYEKMLREWNEALRADQMLSGLPATLPERFFATKTHLTAEGVAEFTRRLASALAANR